MRLGAVKTTWHEYSGDWTQVEAEVIEEATVSVYVNGIEFATIMSTPDEQEFLALGFLANEGLLHGMEEVEILHVSEPGCCVDVWLDRSVAKPERTILTSGCGGGMTFEEASTGLLPLEEDLHLTPEALVETFNHLHSQDSLHARARGVHAAGLTDGEHLLAVTEDIGRHNTIDKLRGICMFKGMDTRGLALLATGRVSSEMMRKGVMMRCPIIASRNSPTSLAIEMAKALKVTLVGYVRRGSMRVYSHPERLGLPQGEGSVSLPG